MLHIEHGIAARDDELIFLVEALRSTDIDRKELPPLLPVWRILVQLVDRCRLDVEGLRRRLAEKDGECSDLKAELQQLAATQGERKVQGEESIETLHRTQRQLGPGRGPWERDAGAARDGAVGWALCIAGPRGSVVLATRVACVCQTRRPCAVSLNYMLLTFLLGVRLSSMRTVSSTNSLL